MQCYAVDSDGIVEMWLPQPIFKVIRPPELSSWGHAAPIEWLREWERYMEKMRHHCTTTERGRHCQCVKRKTLKNLATYVLKKTVTDVADADNMRAVISRCSTFKNDFMPAITSLFCQKLKMDLSIDGCDARVFRYYKPLMGSWRIMAFKS
ncbi:hypothetical protein PHMEG_00031597 [Phytophthora megakarya]|uniref:Uncharacterized protein n=1 Tax=Phytophthora megakarya TaxID=4795 RepID=A0A225UZ04_9STRA|nr:hypothetical protein PHMEG_00031597 [Phytophthora megakarya]